MKNNVLFAIIADMEGHGVENIVGLYVEGLGHMPCVNSKRSVIEQMWNQAVDPAIKAKGRIATFMEVPDVDKVPHN